MNRQGLSESKDKVYPLLSNRCGLHQLAITRKHFTVHFPGFWRTIVRLGHLFEVRTFRLHVKNAILQVVMANFEHIRVSQLPADLVTWKQEKAAALFKNMDPKSRRSQVFQTCAAEVVQAFTEVKTQADVKNEEETNNI